MMDKNRFKHTIQVRVRNYDIDWQGIVHNANILLYCEEGRFAYLEHLGVDFDLAKMQRVSKPVIVRNEIDYKSPARFGELIDVHTRISFIRNSSFAFEGILEEARTKRLIAENVAIHVWLDHRTGKAQTVSDEFRRLVQSHEGKDVAIEWPTYSA
jgi:acyl-CoA thioester hydrolase